MNIFQDLLTLIKTEEGQKALPILASSLTNLAGNPTAANLVAQGAASLSAVIAAEISIGQDALKKLAADVSAVAAAQVAPATAPAATPAAPAA